MGRNKVPKILLLEDDEHLLRFMTKAMRNDGFEVFPVSDVDATMKLIGEGILFDAAVIDFWIGSNVALPILEALAINEPKIPTILISGGIGTISLEEIQAIADVSAEPLFLQKPFKQGELLSMLRDSIG